MEWNGTRNGNTHDGMDVAHTTDDRSRSRTRVASLCLSLSHNDDGWWRRERCYPTLLYPHRHTRTFVPCLHTCSLPRVTRVSPPGFRGGGWWWRWMTHTAVRSVDDVAWIHLPRPPIAWTWTMRPSAIIGDRSTLRIHSTTGATTSHHVTESGRREHGGTELGPLTWHAPIPIPPARIEPTTALRRGRRRRPPCIPIRRHPGK